MMTRASSSFASSSRAVKLVSWLNWRTFSACDRGIRKVKPATFPYLRHHAASLPVWFELGRFCLKTGDRDKKESDPGEPAELKKKKSLKGKKTFAFVRMQTEGCQGSKEGRACVR